MVRFVGVENMARWLAETGVAAAISGLTEYLEHDFRRWPSFELAPRVASHSPVGVIELMPTSDGETYAFKYVNGHPGNPRAGLQTVTAFGLLADVHTGYPVLLSEMTLLTAVRTAATSAMAAKVLARPDSSVMAMIGTGAQAEFQAIAFRDALGIRELRVFDTDRQATAKFVANIDGLGFSVTVASSVAEAVRGADIVTTCTADKRNAIILTDDLVAQGMHINAIGGDCPGKTELDPAILDRAEVFVEYTEQSRIEGEIQHHAADFRVTELWEVLTGVQPGRVAPAQVTVFDSVGFAIEDFSALRYLSDQLAHTDYFTEIDLVAEPADPKNLFGEVSARRLQQA